jgi:plastocyanin
VPGDAVVFETVDHRVHTVSFLTDGLTVMAQEFLETRGVLASLPLVTRGTTFVVILDGAPVGSYPFVSEGHGGHALGRILVTVPEDSAQGVGG